MIQKLWAFIVGWLEVEIKGPRTEESISTMIATGMSLWHLERTREGLRFRLPLRDVSRLRHVAARTRIKTKFLARGGWSMWFKRIRRRPCLGMGAVTGLALLWVITSRIWVIDVLAVSAAQEAQILQVAENAGLKPGILRQHVDVARVEQHLLTSVKGFSWFGVKIHGGFAVIRGFQFQKPLPSSLTSTLVARTAAQVVAVYVYMGEALVSQGDHVRPGQPLIRGISGFLAPHSDQNDVALTPPPKAVAEGEVIGDVTRDIRVYQPYRTVKRIPTGRTFSRLWLTVRGIAVPVAGFGPVPFPSWIAHPQSIPVDWRGINFPACWVRVLYNEVILVSQQLSRQNAVTRASERASRDLSRLTGPDKKVIRRQLSTVADPNGVWVTLTAVIRENIAIAKADEPR